MLGSRVDLPLLANMEAVMTNTNARFAKTEQAINATAHSRMWLIENELRQNGPFWDVVVFALLCAALLL